MDGTVTKVIRSDYLDRDQGADIYLLLAVIVAQIQDDGLFY